MTEAWYLCGAALLQALPGTASSPAARWETLRCSQVSPSADPLFRHQPPGGAVSLSHAAVLARGVLSMWAAACHCTLVSQLADILAPPLPPDHGLASLRSHGVDAGPSSRDAPCCCPARAAALLPMVMMFLLLVLVLLLPPFCRSWLTSHTPLLPTSSASASGSATPRAGQPTPPSQATRPSPAAACRCGDLSAAHLCGCGCGWRAGGCVWRAPRRRARVLLLA